MTEAERIAEATHQLNALLHQMKHDAERAERLLGIVGEDGYLHNWAAVDACAVVRRLREIIPTHLSESSEYDEAA
jgi:hypothetical protein